jgi:hypothetical protein
MSRIGRFVAPEPLGPFLRRLLLVVGEGTARTLRTTQWTRASFELIYFSSIDDLKDH